MRTRAQKRAECPSVLTYSQPTPDLHSAVARSHVIGYVLRVHPGYWQWFKT